MPLNGHQTIWQHKGQHFKQFHSLVLVGCRYIRELKGRTIRKVMGGGGGWEKSQKKIHARENGKKKNSCKEEGKEKKFMQKEGPIAIFI